MVSSKTCKMISLAISLLVVVISLTGTASAAIAPNVSPSPARYTPGLSGAPGKMATDVAGNLYVADFWAKGIVKLDPRGGRLGFIPTASRPTAVAVMPDNRLVVAMSAPQAYVAFYVQTGLAPNITGTESSQFTGHTEPYCRPSDIAIKTVDAVTTIYVLDSGDSGSGAVNAPKVRVYDSTGAYQPLPVIGFIGLRTATAGNPGTTGDLKLPLGMAYEKANNHIVVADTSNGRLQFYNASTGVFVKTVGLQLGRTNGYVNTIDQVVRFGEPADLDFDYNGAALDRIYVADKARGRIFVVDPVTGNDLKHIDSTISGADMKAPTSILFKPGATGGVLYAGSAASGTGINVLAFDVAGGEVPPATTVALAITSNVPPTTITGQSPLTVSGTVSPVNAVYCSVNGNTAILATPSGNDWSVSLGLDNGYNYILCKASDAYAEASTFYAVSTTAAPVVAITSPAAGIYTNNASIVVSGTTDVASANIKLSNANNGDVVTTVSGADNVWSATISLAEGANPITVSAWKAGTDVGTASRTFNLDFTPPSLAGSGSISFLATGATTVTAVQNLDGIVVEENLDSIVVNGNNVTAKVALPAAGNTYFSIPVTLVRGSNTVTVTATDLAGNASVVTRTVTLNPEIPGLTVALPADNSFATGANIAANGTVDTTFATVNAAYTLQSDGATPNTDGTLVTPAGVNWSANRTIATGFKSYQFTASGNGNTAVSEKRTINADAAYVQLAITSPPADFATSSSSVILSGTTVADLNPSPSISIDGAAAVPVSSYTPSTGEFSHTITLSTEGEHSIKVIANASTTAIRNIIYDTTASKIAVQANANTAPVQLTGTIEPSDKMAGITTSLSSVNTVLPMNRITFGTDPLTGSVVWHADLSGYAYDSLSIESLDPAQNLAQYTFVSGVPTGDVDGDGAVRLSDAMACLRHVAGTEPLPGDKLDKNSARFQADVGSLIEARAAQDGVVTVEDAVLILRKAYGLMSF